MKQKHIFIFRYILYLQENLLGLCFRFMYRTQLYKSVCKSFFSSSGDAKLVSSVIWKLLVDTVGISWVKRSLLCRMQVSNTSGPFGMSR